MNLPGRKQSLHGESGFTLLEMLIALTLVALMAVGLWAAFRISLHSWSRGTAFIDVNQRHRSILDMVRKQVASAYGLFAPVDLQHGGVQHLIFNGTGNSLEFISLNSLEFQESPGLTLVRYEIAQDSEGDYALIERETRYTEQIPDQETLASLSRATPVFEKLASCTFEYFDPGAGGNPPQWVGEWDGQKTDQLPAAISMTMISRDPRGNSLSRHMVVPIEAQAYALGVTPRNQGLGARRTAVQ